MGQDRPIYNPDSPRKRTISASEVDELTKGDQRLIVRKRRKRRLIALSEEEAEMVLNQFLDTFSI